MDKMPRLSTMTSQGLVAHAAFSKSLLRWRSKRRFSYGDKKASSSARAGCCNSSNGLAAPNPVASRAATTAVRPMSHAVRTFSCTQCDSLSTIRHERRLAFGV